MSNKSETQQKIIYAAIKIFAAKGYHGTATAEIAREASVAEGTIFKYYKTKKQLLQEVLGFIIHEIVPSIIQQPSEDVFQKCDAANVKAIVKHLLMEKVEIITANINCFKIVVNELQYHEDLKNEYLKKVVPGFIRFMEGVYSMGVNKGAFRDINPHTAVRSFIGMFAFIILEKNLLNSELNIGDELETVIDIYLNGVIEKRESNV